MPLVSVAVPTLDGGARLGDCLAAVAAQRVDRDLEIVVCDSGSTDGTVELARAHGARVVSIARSEFSHGGTRNLLMRETRGEHVAFLSQDAVPAREDWLARLLEGFALAPRVGLAYGPYEPVADASPPVRRELTAWFRSFSPDGSPRVDVLPDGLPADLPSLLGPRSYFTDANGCVARSAWDVVPFRNVAYAEDHVLALDTLAAGFAKVFCPAAAVLHSHEYGRLALLRRSFDEWRGLREVYGHVESAAPLRVAALLRREVRADLRAAREEGRPAVRMLPQSLAHHGVRRVGALLGSRADRLPAAVRRRLSLERRDTFTPVRFGSARSRP